MNRVKKNNFLILLAIILVCFGLSSGYQTAWAATKTDPYEDLRKNIPSSKDILKNPDSKPPASSATPTPGPSETPTPTPAPPTSTPTQNPPTDKASDLSGCTEPQCYRCDWNNKVSYQDFPCSGGQSDAASKQRCSNIPKLLTVCQIPELDSRLLIQACAESLSAENAQLNLSFSKILKNQNLNLEQQKCLFETPL